VLAQIDADMNGSHAAEGAGAKPAPPGAGHPQEPDRRSPRQSPGAERAFPCRALSGSDCSHCCLGHCPAADALACTGPSGIQNADVPMKQRMPRWVGLAKPTQTTSIRPRRRPNSTRLKTRLSRSCSTKWCSGNLLVFWVGWFSLAAPWVCRNRGKNPVHDLLTFAKNRRSVQAAFGWDIAQLIFYFVFLVLFSVNNSYNPSTYSLYNTKAIIADAFIENGGLKGSSFLAPRLASDLLSFVPTDMKVDSICRREVDRRNLRVPREHGRALGSGSQCDSPRHSLHCRRPPYEFGSSFGKGCKPSCTHGTNAC